MGQTSYPIEGGCDCGAVRYKMSTLPMITQCCHCYRCQKRTGSAFVINALIEADRVEASGADPIVVTSKVENLNHQHMSQCPECHVTLWSTFDSEGGFTRFVRVGTLDQPSNIAPDIHLHISSKQPWVIIPQGTPSVEESYEHSDIWPTDSLRREKALEPLRDAHWDKWVIEARRIRLAQKSGLAVPSASTSS